MVFCHSCGKERRFRQISAQAAVLTDEQEELMEMIDVTATQQGIVQTLINQGKEIGSDNAVNNKIQLRNTIYNLTRLINLKDIAY